MNVSGLKFCSRSIGSLDFGVSLVLNSSVNLPQISKGTEYTDLNDIDNEIDNGNLHNIESTGKERVEAP